MAPEIKFLQQQEIMLLADGDMNRSTFEWDIPIISQGHNCVLSVNMI